MTHTIRPIEPRDLDAARDLLRQLTGWEMTPAEMQSRLDFVAASPIDWLFVCEIAGDVVGLLGFRLRERIEHPSRHGEVSVLVTDARVKRQGVGRALLAFAEDFARDQGCVGMFLVSGFKRKDEAHRFYQALGYEITGNRFVKAFD
ncbi:MAG: GNAT family N-acetyltransferase [Anaerolineae bacterium]|nr:GNAT family N-acetyltransferase [Anaerolineae bacterium]